MKVILWDVDGTLLDFDAAERAAIRSLFVEYRLGECTDEMLARYSDINKSYWQKLERGELTKPEVLLNRYIQFFTEYGIDTSIAAEFNDKYQLRLGDTIVFHDNSLELIKRLKASGKYKQYVVSNGTIAAQTKKLKLSGIGALVDGVFLSEEIGVEKPNLGFFDRVFEDIAVDCADKAEEMAANGEWEAPPALSDILIIGDSLTSDIRGGMNAGIRTCWYNPERKAIPEGYHIDWVIADLNLLESYLEGECEKAIEEGWRVKARTLDEEELSLHGNRIDFSDNFDRWIDDELNDKRDQNCFVCKSQPTEEEFYEAIEFQRDRGDNFIKLISYEKLHSSFGIPEEHCLTMVLQKPTDSWKINSSITIRKPTLQEVVDLEVGNFGTPDSIDFRKRNARHNYEKLEYIGAYLGDELAGICYVVTVVDSVCVDGLAVDEKYRKQRVATTLLKHVADNYAGDLLFLHADEADSPQEMYMKLGFVVADVTYEYLKIGI